MKDIRNLEQFRKFLMNHSMKEYRDLVIKLPKRNRGAEGYEGVQDGPTVELKDKSTGNRKSKKKDKPEKRQ